MDYFSLLGVSQSLGIEKNELQDSFYRLSKMTHPDRYVSRDNREALFAGRWSSALNRAFQTLRDPELRSLEILSSNAITLGKNPPTELAELYFELQDLDDTDALKDFGRNLQDRMKNNRQEWEDLATHWESSKENLEKLRANLETKRYLNSMLADLNKRLGVL